MPDADPYAPLRVANFRRYVLAIICMTLATMIQGTIVGWQIYDLTREPLALGLIGLAEAVPFIAVSLYAGHVTDVRDRRRVAIAALIVYFASALALLILPMALDARSRALPRAIYVVIGVSGVARSFLQPARQALGAEVVPRALFTQSVPWRSGAWQLAAVIGPALGGLLYAAGGLRLAYAADAVLTAGAVGLLLRVDRPAPPVRPATEPITQRVASGVRFVFREPVLLGALTLDMFSVLFGGAVALLPIYAADVFHVGASGLGALRSAPAIGAVVMSLILTRTKPFEHAGRTLLRAVALYGLAMIAFGVSTNFGFAVVVLACSGAADMVSVFIRSTLLTTRTPPELLGRVMSVNGIFVGSSNEIGAFESGVTAAWFGAVPSVVLGGFLTLVVVGLTAWKNPSLRTLRRLDPEAGSG